MKRQFQSSLVSIRLSRAVDSARLSGFEVDRELCWDRDVFNLYFYHAYFYPILSLKSKCLDHWLWSHYRASWSIYKCFPRNVRLRFRGHCQLLDLNSFCFKLWLSRPACHLDIDEHNHWLWNWICVLWNLLIISHLRKLVTQINEKGKEYLEKVSLILKV